MAFYSGVLEEDVFITPKGGTRTPTKATIFRDQLQTRATDRSQRVDYAVEAQITFDNYPAAKPNLGGDVIECYIRHGDATMTRKTVSSLISQVGNVWHVRLD